MWWTHEVFFATDIHGSEICWRKFLNAAAFYKADMVVLGGDVTGKVMVPIVAHNGYWQVIAPRRDHPHGDRRPNSTRVETRIRNKGSYPALVTPDELHRLSEEEGAVDRRFTRKWSSSLDRVDGHGRRRSWQGGEIPCILNGGNDDIWEIDDIIEASPSVSFGEGKMLDLDGFHLISMGWTNPPRGTPSGRPRGGPGPQDRGHRRRFRIWRRAISTSTRRRTAPAWTTRPRWTTACGPCTAAPS